MSIPPPIPLADKTAADARRERDRRIRHAVVLLAVAGLLYATVTWFIPIGWIGSLAGFPQFLWDRLPHVPGLSDALKLGAAADTHGKQLEADLAARTTQLREQAASARAAQAQAAAARKQADALARQLADAGKDADALKAKVAQLEADVAQREGRVADLTAALDRAHAQPVAPVRTRSEAVDVLRQMGY